ncbi:MAG: FAD-binding monooxygenase [Litorivicinaceae bacterium]
MQFHLNGFQPGDPLITPASAQMTSNDALPTEVDVLIVGSGPAGLTLAAQLSQFAELRVAVVEQKAGPLKLGQADGIACRTMEMFEAFNFSDRIMREACWVNETTFWKPNPENRAEIARSGRIQDVEDGLSEFPHVILNQARIHDYYLEVMARSASRAVPYYNRKLLDMQIDTDAPANALAVTATFEQIEGELAGTQETIRAKYIVGCDGARSTVRQKLGYALEGDSANQAWGVMDVLAVTDFPDVRMKVVILSDEGSMIFIPREGGYLFRMYIELDKLKPDERVANLNITTEHLVAAANRILHPYTIEVKDIPWWSVYEIGQRVCLRFDDLPLDPKPNQIPHAFIAGDACHTHSPKAGQGMNVSMQDTFNLGWKLGLVLRGEADPSVLRTYSSERRHVAQTLIDFDREFARMFSARPKTSDGAKGGIDPAEFQRYFQQHGRFTAGTAIQYDPSQIQMEASHQHLATGLPIGMRFHSAPVIRVADAKPMHLGHVVKADGRFRVFVFAGEETPGATESGSWAVAEYLDQDPSSPVRRLQCAGQDVDARIDCRIVYQQPFRDIDLGEVHPFWLPRKGKFALVDYEKIFCVDHKLGDDIYQMRGINRADGCIVIVRPDQFVAAVLPIRATQALGDYFGFLR